MWLVVVTWWFWYDCFNISSGFGFGLFCLRGGIWFSDFAGPGLWFVSLWFVLVLWFCGDTLVVGLQVRGFGCCGLLFGIGDFAVWVVVSGLFVVLPIVVSLRWILLAGLFGIGCRIYCRLCVAPSGFGLFV